MTLPGLKNPRGINNPFDLGKKRKVRRVASETERVPLEEADPVLGGAAQGLELPFFTPWGPNLPGPIRLDRGAKLPRLGAI